MSRQNTQSLREYLTAPNPLLTNRKRRGRTNSTSSRWKIPLELRKWKDFDIQSLKKVYDGDLSKVLDQSYALRDFADLPPNPFCQIFDENSFERFLVKWTHSVVTEALAVAQKDGKLNRLSAVYMVSGGQAMYEAQNDLQPGSATARKSYPDWAAINHPVATSDSPNGSDDSSTFGMTHNLLPGDTKISAKWTSANVKPGYCKGLKMAHITPIVQVFNYCIATNSRYGYLITDQELFVVRIRASQDALQGLENDRKARTRNSEAPKQEDEAEDKYGRTIYNPATVEQALSQGVIEYESIPWASSGENQLTVNLALFYLHILASTENTIRDNYPLLSEEKMSNPAVTSSFDSSWSGFSLSEKAPLPDVGETHQYVDKSGPKMSRKRSQARDRDQQESARTKRLHHG